MYIKNIEPFDRYKSLDIDITTCFEAFGNK